MSDRTLDLDPRGSGLYLVRADGTGILAGPIDPDDEDEEIAAAEAAIGAEVISIPMLHESARRKAAARSRRAANDYGSTGETYVGP